MLRVVVRGFNERAMASDGFSLEMLCNTPQILHQTAVALVSLCGVRRAENRGRMGCDKDGLGKPRGEGASPEFMQPYHFAEYRLRGRDSQAKDDARLQHLNLRFQPGATG